MKDFSELIAAAQKLPASETTAKKQPTKVTDPTILNDTADSKPLKLALPAVPYSHEALINLMIENQGADHKKLAAHFGKGTGWFASVLASDSFQLALDPRRSEIQDPSITATMEERFRGLTLSSLRVLQEKMDSKECSDLIVIKSAEIGVKALGMGQIAPVAVAPKEVGTIDTLAERLVAALEKQRGNVKAKPVAEVQYVEVITANGN